MLPCARAAFTSISARLFKVFTHFVTFNFFFVSLTLIVCIRPGVFACPCICMRVIGDFYLHKPPPYERGCLCVRACEVDNTFIRARSRNSAIRASCVELGVIFAVLLTSV